MSIVCVPSQSEWFVRCKVQDRSLFQLRTSRRESRVNGQDNSGVGDDLSDQVAARSFIRSNRFSLCCFVDGLQLSEDHFHHLPNAHSAKTDDSTRVQFETFSPRKLLRTFDPTIHGRIGVKVQNIYQQKQLLRSKWALKYPRPIQVCANLL